LSPPAHARRNADAQRQLDIELTELLEQRITFNQVLGLKVQTLRPTLLLRFDMRPELVGHYQYGRLHGGVIASTLDALGGGALMVAMVDKHPADSVEQAMARFYKLGTIDLRVDFLRPGLGRYFMASAEITRLGGRVGSTQMRLHNDDGVLVATASAAYIVS
jgi:uncharacterized protein (TIGR00369 family)